MRKIVAGINMTLDGYCDHTAVVASAEMHDHYADLIRSAGTLLYGRITYQLMEYWRTLLENPSGNKDMDEFAVAMDNVPKVVFSHTLKAVDWKSARLATRDLKEEVTALKQSDEGGGKDILVGSPSLITSLTQLGLIDEYQICVHPVIVGSGLPLFKNITDRTELKYVKTKAFGFGAVVLYYEPLKQ